MERCTSCFTVEAMVRGYHVYKDIWEAALDEELPCQKEPLNIVDPFAVAVSQIVGHVPRKISSVCSLFLDRNGSITCRVTDHRRYSCDLPQDGMEIPCTLTFEGELKYAEKAKRLIKNALGGEPDDQKPSKRRRVDIIGNSDRTKHSQLWVQHGKLVLHLSQCQAIPNGEKLDDLIINTSQYLLKKQFPIMSGFQSTLYQYQKKEALTTTPLMCIHIFHSRSDHWIVASTAYAPIGVVKVYDSSYDNVDKETSGVIFNLFSQHCSIEVVKSQEQVGGKDCGLFAIGNATALCFGQNPAVIVFDQDKMRSHLLECLDKGTFSLFPSVC